MRLYIKKALSNKKVTVPALAAIALIFFATLLAGLYELGFERGFAQTKNIKIEGLSNAEIPDRISTDFNTFWEAWDKLKSNQIDAKNISDRAMLEGAIKGLAGSFDDPYTVYFNPSDSKKFNDDVRGDFGGVGMEIGIKDDGLIVIAPLKSTPAERAGLKSKDRILKINGEDSTNMTVEDAVSKIRGDVGTKVALTIFRDGWREPKDFEIVREIIKIPALDYEIRNIAPAGQLPANPTNILYVHLYGFNAYAGSLFSDAVREGMRNNIQGVVMDLRNDPGGYLDVAVNMAGWFVKRGSVVVKEEFASGAESVLRAQGNEALLNLPVVVLVNSGSASASEILAGALRDLRGAKLVGEKSFGKGSVQEINDLSDGSTLKITIAHWFTPNGILIDKNGLEPDYKVKISDEDFENKKDPQMDKAIEILKGELSK